LELAALALAVFGACDSYPEVPTQIGKKVKLLVSHSCLYVKRAKVWGGIPGRGRKGSRLNAGRVLRSYVSHASRKRVITNDPSPPGLLLRYHGHSIPRRSGSECFQVPPQRCPEPRSAVRRRSAVPRVRCPLSHGRAAELAPRSLRRGACAASGQRRSLTGTAEGPLTAC